MTKRRQPPKPPPPCEHGRPAATCAEGACDPLHGVAVTVTSEIRAARRAAISAGDRAVLAFLAALAMLAIYVAEYVPVYR